MSPANYTARRRRAIRQRMAADKVRRIGRAVPRSLTTGTEAPRRWQHCLRDNHTPDR